MNNSTNYPNNAIGSVNSNTYTHLPQDLSILVLYSLTTIVALFGNIIVCVVTLRRRVATTTYILIGNLAVSDILGALTIPGQWGLCSTYFLDHTGERGCGMMKSLQILSYYISTFTMTVIAFDRYRIVYYPLSPRMKPWQPICVIWIVSCICVSPTMISMRISEYFTPQRLIYCRVVFKSTAPLFTSDRFRKIRVLFVMVTQYLIPLTISSLFYAFSIRKIVSRHRLGAVTDRQYKEFFRSKKRTIKMLTIALAVFTIAWFPVHLIHMTDFYITPLLGSNCNSSYYYLFFYWLAISTCCYNPFIYCWLNDDFRVAAKATLFCRYCFFYATNNKYTSHANVSINSSRQYLNASIFYVHYS